MQRRHSIRQLMWRGVVAAVGSAAVGAGVYPLAPQVGLALLRRARRRPQPPGYLGASATEWALTVALQAARPVGFLGLPALRRQATGPRPVVLLHGYAQGRANFLVLAHRLRAAGIGPISGFEYWTLGRVEGAATALGRFVDDVRARTGADRVDLVGHSMGGVVARAYVTLGGGGEQVRNLITIGSPHGGSPAARFGVGAPTVELDAGSELLGRLDAAPIPPGVRATCIWSRADGLVPSARHARLAGAEEIAYDDLGHLAMLCSRRVAREVITRLTRA